MGFVAMIGMHDVAPNLRLHLTARGTFTPD
jgi:hypothetical protein